MQLTSFQKIELNKRVDKILRAPMNVLAGGQQLEIAFVADISSGIEAVSDVIKDAAATLKAHDKIFQNVRSNIVYWNNYSIWSQVAPLSFIQIGKVFENIDVSSHADVQQGKGIQQLEELCGYLKLYHARCRCIVLFLDFLFEDLKKQYFKAVNIEQAIENLNPFLKHRILIVTRDKMVPGSEMLIHLLQHRK